MKAEAKVKAMRKQAADDTDWVDSRGFYKDMIFIFKPFLSLTIQYKRGRRKNQILNKYNSEVVI